MAEVAEKYDVGLVFGKFYPLTKGHQHLIDFALRRCRRLYIGVSGRASETIPQEVRVGWIRWLYPGAVVVGQPQTLPYYPKECATREEFYGIWREALREVCGGRSPEVLFTSEDYGEEMGRYLGCRHVMVDRAREVVPISGTKVRGDPFNYWEYLDPVVRSYFVKVVCVYGPESTGKSTLCERLAGHYQTVWQPEWARAYLGERHCEYEDMEIIARGHFGEHAAYRDRANKVLFMDTDAITTQIFSQHYYQRCPRYVAELAERMGEFVDLYLVTDIDVPWVADSSRDLGEPWQREMMRAEYIMELRRRGLRFEIVSGDWDMRFRKAVGCVDRGILGGGQNVHLENGG